ncbi:LOB domain-containing protein 6 [Dorcoceras hygrometricum]|uniref:LOB domain-containing protein 6 n=1 Tax=Dorcoceras hygrometricum TaxID=472368 RepID=A0A2Z7ASE9_9LAMI|nr:LOB domain-containing protein 6 [Dorcoceras hygrometricum]
MASSSNSSPCAACKFLRRKCLSQCVFAPYFPPDQQQKFTSVHKVFGASNVTKLLQELHPSQREDAVNSLAYEAEMRLRDPVYGCVGVISLLQHQLRQLQVDLTFAKSELSKYQNHLTGFLHQHPQKINIFEGGMTAPKDFQHQFFPSIPHLQQQHAVINGYDASSSYHAINMSASIGQFSGFQQANTAGTVADGRPTPLEPS